MNRRLIVLVSVVAALLATGATVAIASSGRSHNEPGPGGPSGSVVHQVTESPHDVETYWNPERMRNAKGD